MNYARVFFYVSNLRDAKREVIATRDPMAELDKPEKNDYEIVLGHIAEKLNEDENFRKYIKAEIYEYSKKNQSNILHFKGLKHNPNEDPAALAE